MTLHTQLEVKKDGLSQRQDGTWKVSFTVHPNDFDAEHNKGFLTAAMGTRYQAVLVAIGDDEQPVTPQPRASNGQSQQHGKQKWEDMWPSKQAALACKDPRFWKWCKVENEADARGYVIAACQLEESRSELDRNPEAAMRWHNDYQRYRRESGQEAEAR